MKRCYILLLIIALMSNLSSISAQCKSNKQDRQKWFKEMREYKHSFLAKELGLNEDQQSEFFPVYDAMETELHKNGKEVRQLERKLKKSEDVSDIEYEKAAEAMFELKGKEHAIEMSYFEKFKNILTKKQLFLLKGAERKFTQSIMKHHNKKKSHNKK